MWNGILYDIPNNKHISELNNGNGFMKEYGRNGKILFEGEYKNG